MSNPNKTSQEDSCEDCQRILPRFKHRCSEPNAFIVHVDVSLLTHLKKKKEIKTPRDKQEKAKEERDKKKEKKNRLEKLLRIASALRNSEGGSILVHLSGHEIGDRYLGYFDEFVSSSLDFLIEDGKLFVDTYQRFWLNSKKAFRTEHGFVCINVGKSSGVSVADFNTKIRNDFENIRPKPLDIFSSLVSLAPFSDTPSSFSVTSKAPFSTRVRGLDLEILQESRNIELKSISHCDLKTKSTKVPDFVDFIWNDLKLRDNITSMSKISEGGSFYVGVAEKIKNGITYDSKEPFFEGFELNARPDKYTKEIYNRLESDISVLNRDLTFTKAPKDLIQVHFHPHTNKVILEVAIRQFEGIVFYDKDGPRAYTIEEKVIRRLQCQELLKRVPSDFPGLSQFISSVKLLK